MSPSFSNSDWLRAFCGAGLCLLLAAVLLWATLPALYPDWAAGSQDTPSLVLPGTAFTPVVAASDQTDGETLIITRMKDGEAVFRAMPSFQAGPHPLVRVNLEGLHPKLRLVLFWRTAEAAGQLQYIEIPQSASGMNWYPLGDLPSWQGTVTEVAVGVFGESRGLPLRLREVSFHGSNARIMRDYVWWQWSTFRPWPLAHLNRYAGATGTAALHPGTVGSLWAALALVLLAGWGRAVRLPRHTLVAAGLATLFLPWLLLDRLWQGQVDQQLRTSSTTFGGLSQADKHYREDDAVLQRYAAHLMRVLPPGRGQRLILLHASSGHNYERLRLQFHLLPHNIYNFGSELLPTDSLRAGDHVLLFGPLADISFDATTGILSDSRYRVHARLVDSHRYGLLYRIELPPTQEPL